MLLGKIPNAKLIAEVADAVANKIPEITGIRKSTAFKLPVCRNMTARILSDMFMEA